MTSNPKSDARLRAALLMLPGPDALQTREALDEVLARSRRSTRGRRYAVPLAAAAAVVAVVAVLTVLLPRGGERETPPAGPDATAVEGTWRRAVSGAEPPGWNGTWRITLDADGVLDMRAPAAADVQVDGASFRIDADRLLVDPFVNDACADTDPGVYRWQRDGSRLVLTAVSELCAARAAVFEGTWTIP